MPGFIPGIFLQFLYTNMDPKTQFLIFFFAGLILILGGLVFTIVGLVKRKKRLIVIGLLMALFPFLINLMK